MPRSKDISKYDAPYWVDIIERALKQPLAIDCGANRAAQNFRLTFYGFKTAVHFAVKEKDRTDLEGLLDAVNSIVVHIHEHSAIFSNLLDQPQYTALGKVPLREIPGMNLSLEDKTYERNPLDTFNTIIAAKDVYERFAPRVRDIQELFVKPSEHQQEEVPRKCSHSMLTPKDELGIRTCIACGEPVSVDTDGSGAPHA